MVGNNPLKQDQRRRLAEAVQVLLFSLCICSLLLLPHPHHCKPSYSIACIYEVTYLIPIIESLAGEMHNFLGPLHLAHHR